MFFEYFIIGPGKARIGKSKGKSIIAPLICFQHRERIAVVLICPLITVLSLYIGSKISFKISERAVISS